MLSRCHCNSTRSWIQDDRAWVLTHSILDAYCYVCGSWGANSIYQTLVSNTWKVNWQKLIHFFSNRNLEFCSLKLKKVVWEIFFRWKYYKWGKLTVFKCFQNAAESPTKTVFNNQAFCFIMWNFWLHFSEILKNDNYLEL